MPGNVLDHRQHAAVEEPLANRIAEQRRQIGGRPGGTIADDRVGVGLRHVQHRGAIDGDAQGRKLGGGDAGVEACRLDRTLRMMPGKPGEFAGCRHRPPVGRLEPDDPSPFLVYENRRIVAADGRAQIGDEGTHLAGVSAVAGEQDESQRAGLAEEAALGIFEDRARTAEDDRPWRVGCRVSAGGQSGTPPCVS